MIPLNEFKKLDIRVGRIIDVSNHPKADKLLVLKIDIGNEVRTIVAGIKNYYERKELRGIKSEGMILAAVKDNKVVLIEPEKDIDVGAVIQ